MEKIVNLDDVNQNLDEPIDLKLKEYFDIEFDKIMKKFDVAINNTKSIIEKVK